MTIWSILRPLEIFCGHMVYFVMIWCIFPRFGILDQEKSGNPATPVFPDFAFTKKIELGKKCLRICIPN
jgi:hypothetical protein